MNRTRCVLLGGFLSLLLLMSATTPAQHRRRHHSTHRHGAFGKNPSELKNKLRAIKARRAQIGVELNKTRQQAHVVTEDIHAVDAKMEQIGNELERTSDRLDANIAEQNDLGAHLKAATKRLGQVRAQVRKRLRSIYLTGEGSFLSALAGTRTVDDLVSEHTLLEAIAQRDRDMFNEYTDLQRDISAKKRRQDQLVHEIQGLVEKKASQKIALADTREEKAHILGNLRERQSDLQRQMAQFDADEADIADEIEAFARRARRPGEVALPAFSGRFIRPAQGPITSRFGVRYHPILHYTRMHKGIDFGAPYGSPILAAADGEVIAARYSQSFGNMIIIAHGGNISTVYAHASRLFVHEGQMVKRGQRIAAVGATGLAKGAHLHWEVHVGGRAVNPLGRF